MVEGQVSRPETALDSPDGPASQTTRCGAAEESPVDPEAVDRAYHYHRARRNARVRRKREKAHARLRFYFTFAVLAGLALFLLLTIWHQVQKVFGL